VMESGKFSAKRHWCTVLRPVLFCLLRDVLYSMKNTTSYDSYLPHICLFQVLYISVQIVHKGRGL